MKRWASWRKEFDDTMHMSCQVCFRVIKLVNNPHKWILPLKQFYKIAMTAPFFVFIAFLIREQRPSPILSLPLSKKLRHHNNRLNCCAVRNCDRLFIGASNAWKQNLADSIYSINVLKFFWKTESFENEDVNVSAISSRKKFKAHLCHHQHHQLPQILLLVAPSKPQCQS